MASTLESHARSHGDEPEHPDGGEDDRLTSPLIGVAPLVECQAALFPDRPAVSTDSECVTYGELNRRAGAVAAALQRLGVEPGATVAVYFERSAELVIAALGALKAGAAYLPIAAGQPVERVGFMLRDAGALVLITHEHLAAGLPEGDWQLLTLEQTVPGSTPSPVPAPCGGDLAYIVYTSGSTGEPKGVECTRAGLRNLIAWHQRAFDVTPADRATLLANPGFDASVWEIWPHLTAGATLCIPSEQVRLSPESLRDWLVAQQITISFLPTPLAERLLALPWPETAALRVMLTGGDALQHYPPAGLPFTVVNNYGVSECTVVSTSGVLLPGTEGVPPIGRAISNVEALILDEDLRPCDPGEAGELCIGGVSLARGYRNRPELTAERFVPHPLSSVSGARLYRTGDRVRLTAAGEIEYLGRLDQQIKIRGYRIEPGEVTAAINRHPSVLTSTTIAAGGPSGERELVAYVVPSNGRRSDAELRDFVRTQVPEYMVPSAFVWLDELPMTPNGKIDRAALPSRAEAATPAPNFVAPTSPVEERIAVLLAELLQRDRVSIDDNFFFLGGHSLLGAQLIARLQQMFGVELSLLTVFERPTVRQLAEVVTERVMERLASMTDEEVEAFLAL